MFYYNIRYINFTRNCSYYILADLFIANCLLSDILNDFDLIRRFRLPENLPKGQIPKNYTIFYYITSTTKNMKILKIDKEVRKPIQPDYENRYQDSMAAARKDMKE